MANTSLQRFLLPQRRHSFANTAGIHESSSPSSILHKHTSSSSLSFRLYSNSSSPPSVTTTSTPTPVTPPATAENPPAPSLDLLARQLAAGDYRQADETTRALLIDLAGEPARRRGYVFFSEVRFIPAANLRAVDALWREHSGGRFGYSVQRRLWEKARRDFTRFFIRVGWMKKLDTEIEQYNYRAFPDEFVWELNDDTPEGHLPLTNALRGTQLLENILTHPAFSEEDEGQGQEEATTEEGGGGSGQSSRDGSSSSGRERPKSMKDLKPDYSF